MNKNTLVMYLLSYGSLYIISVLTNTLVIFEVVVALRYILGQVWSN